MTYANLNYAPANSQVFPPAKLARPAALLFKKMPRRFRPAAGATPTEAARDQLLRIADVAAGTDDPAGAYAGCGFVTKLARRMSPQRAATTPGDA